MQAILVFDEDRILNPRSVTGSSTAATTIRYEQTLPALPDPCPPAIILDIRRDCSEKEERYQLLEALLPGALVLMISVPGDIRALEAINQAAASGALHIPSDLLRHIGQKLASTASRTDIAGEKEPYRGKGESMKEVHRLVSLVAPTDYQVMICGETGTGKEVIARMIHNTSRRKDKPFIAVDCGCLSRDVAGSELFGHVKGAFTDAACDKAGVFELADGGTLFLDEIGNLPYDVQVSLLRCLQEKKIRKTGATREQAVNVRVLAATNESLDQALEEGSFRSDLYYRLNEVSIVLPPLRERTGDILPLAHQLLAAIAAELGKETSGFSPEAEQRLLRYAWPGNIRELKNALKRACLLTPDGRAIPAGVLPGEPGPAFTGLPDKAGAVDLKQASAKAEQERIIKALEMAHFNKRKAADLLHVHRKTLYNKLKEMNIG